MNKEAPKVVLFGCPLDCDEKHDSLEEKRNRMWSDSQPLDPLDGVLACLREDPPDTPWEAIGSIPVPDWLLPMPPISEAGKLVVDHFVAFMDDDGCRMAAEEVQRIVSQRIFPALPCMVAVDHALTGGAVKAVAQRVGVENLSLVILDSHTDAMPMDVLGKAVAYDMETNPNSVFSADDPFLKNRADSFNASSFLHHMLSEGTILPRNLFIIGVSDFPEKKAARIKDPRIKAYVEVFTGLKKMGAVVIPKKEVALKPKKVKTLINRIRTSHVYVSIDMDIGSKNAVDGVRFRNYQGLNEKQIIRTIDGIRAVIRKKSTLAGMDITEINPRRAGGPDPTYRLAAELIKRIIF